MPKCCIMQYMFQFWHIDYAFINGFAFVRKGIQERDIPRAELWVFQESLR